MAVAGFGRRPQLEEKMLKSEEELSRLKEVRFEKQVLRAERRVLGAQEHQEQLLPGIPTDITLEEITTKLPWREFYVLALVSRGWHNAIRNRQVYDARVRSRLTETFLICDYIDNSDGGLGSSRLVVCCLRDNSRLELPPIPHFHEGNPWANCMAVDGKVYVLGSWSDDGRGPGGAVYMFDLAGQRPWTQCASMLIPRYRWFGCGLMDGKIYVFGGLVRKRYSCEAEVFDPKENRWSLITPMPVSSCYHEVVAFGEELVVYQGMVEKDVDCLEIYCPVKDEWRTVSDPFRKPYRRVRGSIFVAQGKLHAMNYSGIYVQNFDGSSCTQLYSNSFAPMEEAGFLIVDLLVVSILIVDDEILARGFLHTRSRILNGEGNSNVRDILLRASGFGSDKKGMAWREEKDWPSKGRIRFMHAIQL